MRTEGAGVVSVGAVVVTAGFCTFFRWRLGFETTRGLVDFGVRAERGAVYVGAL
jgi:hypothetical protein